MSASGAISMVKAWFPSATTWNVDLIPDLSGKVAIVTGGNTGIGRETVKQLLKKNAKVYMASRSKARADEAIAALEAEIGKRAIFLELDLASIASVLKTVAAFQSQQQRLDMLFNSGGVMTSPIEMITADGYDLQFGTNVLGHAVLTLGLIDQLLAAAKASPDRKARVINVSSNAAYITFPEGMRWETLKDGPKRRKESPALLYGQSKYGNYAFSCELARRYGSQGIVSNSLHPGVITTELMRYSGGVANMLMRPFKYPVEMGALTQLYVGTAPETANAGGKWYTAWCTELDFKGPKNEAIDGPKIWEWIEEQRKPFLQ